MIINIDTMASYIPGKNTLLYSSEMEEPLENVTASFCYLFTKDSQIILANNRKRGLEIAGGHVEKGESPSIAAFREQHEETGSNIKSINYFMTAKHTCLFDKPENYKYPYPVSYMNFYVSKNCLCVPDSFIETEECKKPELVKFSEHENGITLFPNRKQENIIHDFLIKNPYFNIFAKKALETVK